MADDQGLLGQAFVAIRASLQPLADDLSAAKRAVGDAMREMGAATKTVGDEMGKGSAATSGWLSSLSALGHSFVVRVAEGVLLRDAIRGVVDEVKAAVLAFPNLVESTVKLGSELLTTSLKTGISVESLSKWRYVAGQTGTDLPSITTAIFRMQVNLAAVGDEGKKVAASLTNLHLSLADLKNMKPDEAFLTILTALHEMPSASDRAGQGAAIFGRGWKENSQLASENVGELLKQAERLGVVMSTDTAAAAKAAEDAMRMLGAQFEAVGVRLAAAFLPALIGVTHDLSEGFKAAVDGAGGALGDMGKSGGFLDTVAKAMGTGDKAIAAQTALYYQLRDALIALIRGGVEPSVSAFSFLMQEWDALKIVSLNAVAGIQLITFALESFVIVSIRASQASAGVGGLFGPIANAANAAVASLEKDKDRLATSMAAIQKMTADDKANQQDWANSGAAINAKIEAGLKGVEAAHVDVAKVIKDIADLSRAAATAGGTALAGMTKEGEKLAEAWKEYNSAGSSYAAILDKIGNATYEGIVADHAKVSSVEKLALIYGVTVTQVENVLKVEEAYKKKLEEVSKATDHARALEIEIAKIIKERTDVVNKLEIKSLEGRLAAERAYNDVVARETMTAADLAVHEIQDREAKELASLDRSGGNWQEHERLIKATADKEVADIRYAQTGIVAAIAATSAEANRSVPKVGQTLNELVPILSGLSNDFVQLAQIGGSSFSDMARQIGTAIKGAESLGKIMQAVSKINYTGEGGGMTAANITALSASLTTAAVAWYQFWAAYNQGRIAAQTAALNLAADKKLADQFHSTTTFSDALNRSISTTAVTLDGISGSASAAGLHINDIVKELGGWASLTAEQLKAVEDSIYSVSKETTLAGGTILKGGVEQGLFAIIAHGGVAGAEATKQLDEALVGMGGAAVKNGGLVSEFFVQMIQKAKAAHVELAGVADLMAAQVKDNIVGGLTEFSDPGAAARKALADADQKRNDITSKLTDAQAKDLAKIEDLKAKIAKDDAAHAQADQRTLDDLIAKQDSYISQLFDIDAEIAKQQGIIAATAVVSEAAATGMGAAADNAFQQMLAAGTPILDIVKTLTPVVQNLQQQFADAGFTGGAAFADLQANVALASDAIAGPALQSVAGLGKVLTGLHNTGGLTQEMFTGLADQVAGTFKRLVDGGADGNRVMRLMQSPLQTIWELHKNAHLEIDDETKALLDQAEAQGVVGQAMESVQQQSLDALNRIADALDRAFGGMPAKAKTAADGITDELGRIKTPSLTVPVTYLTAGAPSGDSYATTTAPGAWTGGRVTASGLQRFDVGGVVQPWSFGQIPVPGMAGGGGRDTIPIWASAGEAVYTPGQQDLIGDALRAKREAGQAAGGPTEMTLNLTLQVGETVMATTTQKIIWPQIREMIRRNRDGSKSDLKVYLEVD